MALIVKGIAPRAKRAPRIAAPPTSIGTTGLPARRAWPISNSTQSDRDSSRSSKRTPPPARADDHGDDFALVDGLGDRRGEVDAALDVGDVVEDVVVAEVPVQRVSDTAAGMTGTVHATVADEDVQRPGSTTMVADMIAPGGRGSAVATPDHPGDPGGVIGKVLLDDRQLEAPQDRLLGLRVQQERNEASTSVFRRRVRRVSRHVGDGHTVTSWVVVPRPSSTMTS